MEDSSFVISHIVESMQNRLHSRLLSKSQTVEETVNLEVRMIVVKGWVWDHEHAGRNEADTCEFEIDAQS